MSAARPPRHPTAPPTAVSLRRWLCAWLALLTFTQMVGSTLAGLQGTWHRHRPSAQTATPSVTVVRWQHGEVMRSDAHAKMHLQGEAHDHAATDLSVLPFSADTATEAAAQLAAAVAPGADVRWGPHDGAHHVQAGETGWAPTTRSITPPLQPPRG